MKASLLDAQTVEYKLLASLNALNVAQSLIIFSGLAAGELGSTACV